MSDKYEGRTQTEIWLMDASSIEEEHEALLAENKRLREALEAIRDIECNGSDIWILINAILEDQS